MSTKRVRQSLDGLAGKNPVTRGFIAGAIVGLVLSGALTAFHAIAVAAGAAHEGVAVLSAVAGAVLAMPFGYPLFLLTEHWTALLDVSYRVEVAAMVFINWLFMCPLAFWTWFRSRSKPT